MYNTILLRVPDIKNQVSDDESDVKVAKSTTSDSESDDESLIEIITLKKHKKNKAADKEKLLQKKRKIRKASTCT